MKLCKDCKWCKTNKIHSFFSPKGAMELAECISPNRWFEINLVTGEKSYRFKFCYTHRGDSFEKHKTPVCGIEGRWFEPKEEK